MKTKFKYEYAIQGNYGYGWEDVTACEDKEEADGMLKCYNSNEKNVPHRIMKYRVKVCEK